MNTVLDELMIADLAELASHECSCGCKKCNGEEKNELEVLFDEMLDYELNPVLPTPTPGAFYQVKRNDNLLAVVGRAYKVREGGERLKLAQMVNNDPRNRKFWIPPNNNFNRQHFKDGVISFSPRFTCGEQQRVARGNEKRCFAKVFLPDNKKSDPASVEPQPSPKPTPHKPPNPSSLQLTCDKSELKKIQGVLGRNVALGQLQSGLRKRAQMAADLCIKSAQMLEKNPIAESVRGHFIKAFNVQPEKAADWLKEKGWNSRGDLVAHRLRTLAKMLSGSTIKYFCEGKQDHCGECPGNWSSYFACSSFGKERVICLGESFWKEWRENKISANVNTLIHEALHIYFGTLIGHGDKGKFSDANCYSYFVLSSNNKSIRKSIKERCSATKTRK